MNLDEMRAMRRWFLTAFLAGLAAVFLPGFLVLVAAAGLVHYLGTTACR